MSRLTDQDARFLLLLPERAHPADAYRALVEHPEVAAYRLAPLWALAGAGVDLGAALPAARTLTLENLPDAVEALRRLCTSDLLERHARALWRRVDERVRSFHLQRGALETFASIFRLGPRTADLPPPAGFALDLAHAYGLEMEYRLRAQAEPFDPIRPPEEGLLVFHPFDAANALGRREAGLEEEPGVGLELLADAAGGERHEEVLRDVAERRGWDVVVLES